MEDNDKFDDESKSRFANFVDKTDLTLLKLDEASIDLLIEILEDLAICNHL